MKLEAHAVAFSPHKRRKSTTFLFRSSLNAEGTRSFQMRVRRPRVPFLTLSLSSSSSSTLQHTSSRQHRGINSYRACLPPCLVFSFIYLHSQTCSPIAERAASSLSGVICVRRVFPFRLSCGSSFFPVSSCFSHRVSHFLSLVCLLVLIVFLWPSSSFFPSLSLSRFSLLSPFLFLCSSVCFSLAVVFLPLFSFFSFFALFSLFSFGLSSFSLLRCSLLFSPRPGSTMDFDASEAARFLFEGSESEGEDEFFDDLLRLDERSGAAAAQVSAQSEDAGDLADESLPRGPLIAPREEIVLFCVDCVDVENLFRRATPTPSETDSERDEEAPETKLVPWAEILTACTKFVRRKIVSGQRLIFGVFLVGTGASENALGFPHISAALPVDEVDVQTILRLQALSQLSEEDFRTQFGDALSRTSPECPPLADVFWVLSHALSAGTRRRATRTSIQQRIILFTSHDSPCPTGAPEALAAATQRLRDLREDGVDVCLVPLEFPGTTPFAMETFWGDALCLVDDEVHEGEGSDKTTPTLSTYKSYVRLRMDELNDNIRLLDRTQRVLSIVPLHLRPSLQVPVCLLSSVRPQPLPRPHAVLTADEKQEPLRPGCAVQILPGPAKLRDVPGETSWETRRSRAYAGRRGYADDEEQTEQREEEREQEGEQDAEQREGERREGEESKDSRLMRRLQLLGPDAVGYYTFAGGKKIGLEWTDIKAMKDFGSPGLTLLCCLPAASLDFELTSASPLFVTTAAAAERAAGRTDFSGFKAEQEKLFAAFLMTLCQRELVAVARLVSKRDSPASLVALLPQLEEVDEAGNTVQAPGLHLLRLPFAEDIRQIDFHWSSSAGCRNHGEPADVQDKASRKEDSERQIQAAMRVLNAFSVEDFHPHQLRNDALQRHFALVEAFALGAEDAELPPPTLTPHLDVLENAEDAIREWKKSVYRTTDEAYVPPTPRWVAETRRADASKKFGSSQAPAKRSAATSPSSQRRRRSGERWPSSPLSPEDGESDACAGEQRRKRRKSSEGAARAIDRGIVTDAEFETLFREDRVASLTVPRLTAWIRRHGAIPRPKKADLVLQAEAIWETRKE
ncbi:UNVERIFIED_CONTAM: hypothetical protein HHA_248160 [Hammondia hammondi]|eukprot:XP_008883832.1 hypothetical protein HHA_248160 [Hammondia hammondi]